MSTSSTELPGLWDLPYYLDDSYVVVTLVIFVLSLRTVKILGLSAGEIPHDRYAVEFVHELTRIAINSRLFKFCPREKRREQHNISASLANP